MGALALAIVAPVLVPLAFGDAYEDSVQALWLLLPGTVALAGSKVLTSYIFSRGRPILNTGITAVSLVVTVAADLILIPLFDVNGAAIASSLAYVVALCCGALRVRPAVRPLTTGRAGAGARGPAPVRRRVAQPAARLSRREPERPSEA